MRLRILDRYLLSELGGTFGFGLAAFTLIFSATEILAIGRMVSQDHAPLWAAIEVFLWELPKTIQLTLPMALLLGTLLAIQRLSGESEITAMKAGGITFVRIVAPLLTAGFFFSLVDYALQEYVVPYAQDQKTEIVNAVVSHNSAFSQNLTDTLPLPGGGSQRTFATGYDKHNEVLLHVTMIQYDAKDTPTRVLFADSARFSADKWSMSNVTIISDPTADDRSLSKQNSLDVQLAENPAGISKQAAHNNPDDMSRADIATAIRAGQLGPTDVGKFTTTYWEKLAQPFACFVFTLTAVPFGIRSIRGGGSTSLGFGLAVLIVFIYYIVATITSYISGAFLSLAWLWAWLPNIIFTWIGAVRLRRAALV